MNSISRPLLLPHLNDEKTFNNLELLQRAELIAPINGDALLIKHLCPKAMTLEYSRPDHAPFEPAPR
ncbi:hypothetical protein QNM99_18210 [Pseudomonas sp. PCH446]